MNMNYELAGILITVVLQALYMAFKMGKMEEKLTQLEHKQDRHNNLIERMVKAESNISALWHKVDEE